MKIQSQCLLCAFFFLAMVPVAGLGWDAYKYHQAASIGPFSLSSDKVDRDDRLRETISHLEKFLAIENSASEIGAYLSNLGFNCRFLRSEDAGETPIEFVCGYNYSGSSLILYDRLIIRMDFDTEYKLKRHEIFVEVV